MGSERAAAGWSSDFLQRRLSSQTLSELLDFTFRSPVNVLEDYEKYFGFGLVIFSPLFLLLVK